MKIFNLKSLFFIIGSFIFLSGSVINFSHDWAVLPWSLRIFIPLISSAVFYYLGLFLNARRHPSAGLFFLIFSVLFFLSLLIILTWLGLNPNSMLLQELSSGFMGIFCLLAYFLISRKNIFMILFITFLTYLLLSLLYYSSPAYQPIFNLQWRLGFLILLGLTDYAVGFIFSRIKNLKPSCHFLYFLGSTLVLFNSIFLNQSATYPPNQWIWDFGLILFVIMVLVWGFLVRSKIILILGSLFLAFDILLTAENHSNSLQTFSNLLMAIGGLLIFIGIFNYYLFKKISQNKNN